MDSHGVVSQTMEQQCGKKEIKLKNLIDTKHLADTLHKDVRSMNICPMSACLGSLITSSREELKTPTSTLKEAEDFINEFYEFTKRAGSTEHTQRLKEVQRNLQDKGTYEHTVEELEFGTKTAWRNAPRCIGRIQWRNLKLIDGRHAKTAADMFECICEHLKYATNEGNIRSTVTVFPPRLPGRKGDFRVWNSQLIQFAGYETEDGEVVGDPINIKLTQVCQRLGWQGKGSQFDVLPIVLQAPGKDPEAFVIPPELVQLVDLRHPNYPWFADLGLKWYGVPAVADMMFDCGGLQYTACPFNGWYMVTEIGSRDLCDTQRYNILPLVGEKMGLDIGRPSSLWKDRAVVEVNVAVIYSYQQDRVTINDHHTASESFMQHMEMETETRGGCPADWVWIVPPLSGSVCPVFHQEMVRYQLKPSYEYQEKAYLTYEWKTPRMTFRTLARTLLALRSVLAEVKRKRAQVVTRKMNKVTILYATETGRSLLFAKKTVKKLQEKGVSGRVVCMADYDVTKLQDESYLLVVTSTFGNGEPPANGRTFWNELCNLKGKTRNLNFRYSVLALGSSLYANFCRFGKDIDRVFTDLGAVSFSPLVEADDNNDQQGSYSEWSKNVVKQLINKREIVPPTKIAKINPTGISVVMTPITVNVRQLNKTPTSKASPSKIPVIKTPGSKIPAHAKRGHKFQSHRCRVVDTHTILEQVHSMSLCRAKVTQRSSLQAENTEPRYCHVEVVGLEKTDLGPYEPGDHLKVYPHNRLEDVQMVLSKTVIDKQNYQIPILLETLDKETGQWVQDERFPCALSLKQALTCVLDLMLPVTDGFLHALEAENLLPDSLKNMMMGSRDPTLQPLYLEVLEKLAPNCVEASLLLHHIPPLRPRTYSISSSPLELGNNALNLSFKEVIWTKAGRNHKGVASDFLIRIPKGDAISCSISPAHHFRLKRAGSRPVLMVAQGIGISPFRSFWKHKDMQLKQGHKNKTGPLHLYFGCRHPRKDFLFKSEVLELKFNGVIDEVKVCFSQDESTEKMHVQELLIRNAEQVGKLIHEEECHVFYSGSLPVWDKVNQAIIHILRIIYEYNQEDAKSYVEDMRSQNRLVRDLFV